MPTVSEKLYNSLRRKTSYGPIIIPSESCYRSIFAWDSGWNYFWLKTISKRAAADELLTLFRTAHPDGRIPHETPCGNDKDYGFYRKVELFMLSKTFDKQGSSFFIDPPVYLWAAADLLQEAENNSTLLNPKELLFIKKTIDNKLNWLIEYRTISTLPEPFCRLPSLLHPFESGTDLSPVFDSIYGGPVRLLAKMLTIQSGLKSDDWNLDNQIPSKPSVLIYDLTWLSFYLIALEKNKRLSGKTAEGFYSAFYNSETLSFDSYILRNKKLKRIYNPTFSSMLPFLLDFIDYETGKLAVKTHCLPGKTFFKGILPSYNPADRSRHSRHLWRGSCSWMNMNYCHWLLLHKYGFKTEASALAAAAGKAVADSILPEYFDSFTLKPGGAPGFSWNGLSTLMY